MQLLKQTTYGNGLHMTTIKTLQEKLDEASLALEPVLWEILKEIEEN